MKKTLLAAAVLASVSGVASAATSVTLYGLVDANFNYENVNYDTGTSYRYTNINGVQNVVKTSDSDSVSAGSGFTMRDGGAGGLDRSRVGIRGNEDLGNGLSAIFEVESRFNLDNGMNADVSMHHSYVGLKGSFGEVTLGKRATISDDLIGMDGIAKELGTSFKETYANSLSYRGTFGGFTVGADLATRENAGEYKKMDNGYKTRTGMIGGAENNGRNGTAQYDIGMKYSFLNGKAGFAAAYQHNGDQAVNKSILDNLPDSTEPTYSDAWGLGFSYDFGMVAAFARYTQGKSKLSNYTLSTAANPTEFGNASLKGHDWSIGADIKFTPRDTLGLAYSQQHNKLEDSYWTNAAAYGTTYQKAKAQRVSAVYAHDLSKRTTVYALADYTQGKYSKHVDASSPGSILSTYTPDGKATRTAFGVGVRHKF